MVCITELTLILKNIKSVRNSHGQELTLILKSIAQCDVKHMLTLACGVMVCGYVQVTFWAIAAEKQAHRIRDKFLRNVLRQEIGHPFLEPWSLLMENR
jgi:hypothetical protein